MLFYSTITPLFCEYNIIILLSPFHLFPQSWFMVCAMTCEKWAFHNMHNSFLFTDDHLGLVVVQ